MSGQPGAFQGGFGGDLDLAVSIGDQQPVIVGGLGDYFIQDGSLGGRRLLMEGRPSGQQLEIADPLRQLPVQGVGHVIGGEANLGGGSALGIVGGKIVDQHQQHQQGDHGTAEDA